MEDKLKKLDVFYVVLGIPTILTMFYRLVIAEATKGDFWGTLGILLLLVVNVWIVSDSLHAILTAKKEHTHVTFEVVEK